MKNDIIINQIKNELDSSDKDKVLYALLYASFNFSDWKWIQNKCIEFLDSEDPDIKGLAITCLGHIARVNHALEKVKVIKALNEKVKEENLKGRVQDTIDDIEIFLNKI